MGHALAVGDDMRIAQPFEHGLGKQTAFDLGFLKAQDVGRLLAQEFLDDADAGADAVDVPGSDACHGASLYRGGGRFAMPVGFAKGPGSPERGEIGRASCRARVCKYVEILVVGVILNKKTIYNNTE